MPEVLWERNKNNQSSKKAATVDFHQDTVLLYGWERLHHSPRDLFMALEERLDKLMHCYSFLDEKEKLLVEDFYLYLTELSKMEQLHNKLVHDNKSNNIWIEGDDRNISVSITLRIQPLYIDSFLANEFYLKKKAVIYTSNAMTVAGSFQFIREQLGLAEFPVVCKQFHFGPKETEHVNIFALEDCRTFWKPAGVNLLKIYANILPRLPNLPEKGYLFYLILMKC